MATRSSSSAAPKRQCRTTTEPAMWKCTSDPRPGASMPLPAHSLAVSGHSRPPTVAKISILGTSMVRPAGTSVAATSSPCQRRCSSPPTVPQA
jgi:hypothetical protein